MKQLTINRKDLKYILDTMQKMYDHLEYCGWGDSWERSCAVAEKLPSRTEKAIELGKELLK